MSFPSQTDSGLAVAGSVVEDVAERDEIRRQVRDLDADRLLARDRRQDADLRRRERVREVVLERRDLGHLRPGRELELVAGDARAGDLADDASHRRRSRPAPGSGTPRPCRCRSCRLPGPVRASASTARAGRSPPSPVRADRRGSAARWSRSARPSSGGAAGAPTGRRRPGSPRPRPPAGGRLCGLSGIAGASGRSSSVERRSTRRLAAVWARRTAPWERWTSAPTDAPDRSRIPAIAKAVPAMSVPVRPIRVPTTSSSTVPTYPPESASRRKTPSAVEARPQRNG